MDRIFMYVPNTLNFTDTFNYEAQNTGALRMFYEAAAGNGKGCLKRLSELAHRV